MGFYYPTVLLPVAVDDTLILMMILRFFTTAQPHVIQCKIFISQFPLVAALSQSCVLDIDEAVQGDAELLCLV